MRRRKTDSADLDSSHLVDLIGYIERTGVVERLAELNVRRSAAGRPATGINYPLKAVLVALFYLIRHEQRATQNMSAVFRLLVMRTTPEQRRLLGVIATDAQVAAVTRDDHTWNAEVKRAALALTRQLQAADPHLGVPARRHSQAERRRRISSRSRQIRDRSVTAQALADELVNAIIRPSVPDTVPGYRGDVTMDETTIKTAEVAPGMGTRPTQKAPATPGASIYRRSKGVVTTDETATVIDKTGVGIGVTAVMMIGPPGSMAAVPRYITAIAVRHVTPANTEAAVACLQAHHRNGFTVPRAPNAKLPVVYVDKAYPFAVGWTNALLRLGYRCQGRQRKDETFVVHSQPVVPGRQLPGPVMIEGALYCPFAATLPNRLLGRSTRELKGKQAWIDHDDAIRESNELLMGIQSRLKAARPRPGRPTPSQEANAERRLRQELICPALQGRLRCSLRTDSMIELDPAQYRTITPDWAPDTYASCCQKTVTVVLTDQQVKHYSNDLPRRSWEHILAHEAGRALTEQSFSIVKSPTVTGVNVLNTGPRRGVWMGIVVAMAVATYNENVTNTFVPCETDTYTRRFVALSERLGRPPAKLPPRT